MKKIMTVVLVGVSLLGGYVAGSMSKQDVKTDKYGDKVQVIENEKVKVEYYDIKKTGGFDIVVTTKGDSKVMTEFQMDEGKEYNEAYLIGRVK